MIWSIRFGMLSTWVLFTAFYFQKAYRYDDHNTELLFFTVQA